MSAFDRAPGKPQGDADSEDMLIRMAEHLGINASTEHHLLWIAVASLNAPLPTPWTMHADDEGQMYFHNEDSGESSWEHPLDSYFVDLVQKIHQSHAGDAISQQLQAQVLNLQQQLELVSQQLSVSNQLASDNDVVSDALRKDVLRLQQQLRLRDMDALAAAERDAAAAAAVLASENKAAQLLSDALVAQAREDTLRQRADAATQRMKVCEHDVKLLSDEKQLIQQELQELKAAGAELNLVNKELLLKHQEQVSKLVEELEIERVRASKLDVFLTSMAASSTVEADSLKQQLCAANLSLVSNQNKILQLEAAAVTRDRQLQAAVDSRAESQGQVDQLKQDAVATSTRIRQLDSENVLLKRQLMQQQQQHHQQTSQAATFASADQQLERDLLKELDLAHAQQQTLTAIASDAKSECERLQQQLTSSSCSMAALQDSYNQQQMQIELQQRQIHELQSHVAEERLQSAAAAARASAAEAENAHVSRVTMIAAAASERELADQQQVIRSLQESLQTKDAQSQHLAEQMGIKMRQLEEDCKITQLQLQKYELECKQHIQLQQQCLQEEKKNSEETAILQSQIQNMRSAAAAAALELQATTEQLRTCRSALEEQHKELELLQQDRGRAEALYHQKCLEKDELIHRLESNLQELHSTVQREEAQRLKSGHSILRPEIGSAEESCRQTPSNQSTRAPPPPPAALPENILQQSIRARYNDSVSRYPLAFSPPKARPVPAAANPATNTSGQLPRPVAPQGPQCAGRAATAVGRGRGFSGGEGLSSSRLTPQVMQQLLALPRGSALPARQQQQHTNAQHLQNDLHMRMQQEAREHLKQQQQQQQQHHQKMQQNVHSQIRQSQQQLSEDILWGDMQNIMPNAASSSVSLQTTRFLPNAGFDGANPSTEAISATESSSPSTSIPTSKTSGNSRACTVS